MRLIGLAGRARTGKDSIADRLDQHGYFSLAFADPIRNILLNELGFPRDLATNEKEQDAPEFGASYRKMAQTLGDWGRALHPDFWIHRLEQHIDEFADPPQRIVITDVRYPNEAAWIRDRGQLWHVRRPEVHGHTRPHSSEEGLPVERGEPLIWNDRDLAYLHARVDALLGMKP